MSVLAKKIDQEVPMIEKFISPGDKLEMKSTQEVTLPDGTEGVKLYKTSVFDVLDDGKIMIVMPMEKSKMVLLPIDGEYEVCFFSHGGMYNANIRIIDRQKINNTYVLISEMVTNLHKFQRREYYRFNCIVEMLARELAKSESEAFEKQLCYLVSEMRCSEELLSILAAEGFDFFRDSLLRKVKFYILDLNFPLMMKKKNSVWLQK